MKNCTQLLVEPYIKYKKFVEECKDKTYDEELVLHKHHIIPKNLGGDNSDKNLVHVSVEDHIEMHILLSECFSVGTKEHIDNLRSARVLNKKSIIDKKTLEKITKSYVGANNPFYGKKHTQETKKKISENNKKRKGISYEKLYGDKVSEEKKKRSVATKKYWDSLTKQERETRKNNISKSLSDKRKFGGKNPYAKKVEVNGIRFGSMSEACLYFKVNSYFLKKKFKIKEI